MVSPERRFEQEEGEELAEWRDRAITRSLYSDYPPEERKSPSSVEECEACGGRYSCELDNGRLYCGVECAEFDVTVRELRRQLHSFGGPDGEKARLLVDAIRHHWRTLERLRS